MNKIVDKILKKYLVFVGFSWDGYIEWYEALVLLLLYVLYVGLMKINPKLMDAMLKLEERVTAW